jgi:hypothetical protein
MANNIIKVNDQHFKLTARGSEMNLKFEDGWWVMYTVNATVRAFRRGFAIPKFHKTLKDVEDKYKTWAGIAAIAG